MGRSYRRIQEISSEGAGDLAEWTELALEELARLGARQLLETMLEAEVRAALGRVRYERLEGEQQGYRNGTRPGRMQMGCGVVEYERPKVTGAKEPFYSKVLPAWKRRTAEIEETIPLLYAEGPWLNRPVLHPRHPRNPRSVHPYRRRAE